MDKCFLRVVLCVYALFLPASLYTQDLSISPQDLRIEPVSDGGFNLFIRYKSDISSVLLTETTRDPKLKEHNYAYRAVEPNNINGDEIRLIDGYPIPRENHIYSLISSTPKRHPELDWAYHIYIPDTLYYGYEGGRHGEVQVGDGTYINVRTFYYAYADYRGPFKDNPFKIHFKRDTPPAAQTYARETVTAFTEIAGKNTVYATGNADLIDKIENILKKENIDDTEIVICLDATGSMRPYIDTLRLQLVNMLKDLLAESDSFKIGLVLFKDYNDEYLNRVFPYTSDFYVLQRNLNAVRVGKGGDIPEAVYEALYAGATKFTWTANTRIMILVGDAPPHARPRGKITKQLVNKELTAKEIKIHAVILPQEKK